MVRTRNIQIIIDIYKFIVGSGVQFHSSPLQYQSNNRAVTIVANRESVIGPDLRGYKINFVSEICCNQTQTMEGAVVSFTGTSVHAECFEGRKISGSEETTATYSCLEGSDWLTDNNNPKCERMFW